MAEGGEAAGAASAHSRAAAAVVDWATGRATLLLVCAPRRGTKTRLYHPTTRMVQVNRATISSASMGRPSLWTAASREQVCSSAFSSTNPPNIVWSGWACFQNLLLLLAAESGFPAGHFRKAFLEHGLIDEDGNILAGVLSAEVASCPLAPNFVHCILSLSFQLTSTSKNGHLL